MVNRLGDAVSPYLRSHADNPVDWQQWGAEAFEEAQWRNVPVMISIGYSTCHWCHVMARESFSDPVLAALINERFVAIKVDREEYPDVDSSYLAAAGAFTEELGWPLTIFATPEGKTFYAGTYYPPTGLPGRPSFRQVLGAVLDAWHERRDEVETNAAEIAAALTTQGRQLPGALPSAADFALIVKELAGHEDREVGGFGGAPKFPVAPVIGFLLDREHGGDESGGGETAGGIARRMLESMASSEIRDPVEGGFFRYAVRRDWSEPHYERMLYDNAQLLACYADIGRADVADGIASFLLEVLRLPSGGFASAQDSESTVDGVRVEGGYYALDAAARALQPRPALDDKVLTGWNGLAIEALAFAGTRLGRPDWVRAAREAADHLGADIASADIRNADISNADSADAEVRGIVRARIGDRVSAARPTLEDYGMLASGLIEVALATGEVRYAQRARALVVATMRAAAELAGHNSPFAVPGGADPVLAGHGLTLDVDPSEGAYPSGLTAIADAARRLHLLTGDRTFLDAATSAMGLLAPLAVRRPISFGAALRVMSALDAGAQQLVIVIPDAATAVTPNATASESLESVARARHRAGAITSVVTEAQAFALATAGFELYAARGVKNGRATAYLCEDFICQLPATTAGDLRALFR